MIHVINALEVKLIQYLLSKYMLFFFICNLYFCRLRKQSQNKYRESNAFSKAEQKGISGQQLKGNNESAIKVQSTSVPNIYSSIPPKPGAKNDQIHFVQKEDEPLYYDRRNVSSHSPLAGYVPSAVVHHPVSTNKVTVNGKVMNGLEQPTGSSNVKVISNGGIFNGMEQPMSSSDVKVISNGSIFSGMEQPMSSSNVKVISNGGIFNGMEQPMSSSNVKVISNGGNVSDLSCVHKDHHLQPSIIQKPSGGPHVAMVHLD